MYVIKKPVRNFQQPPVAVVEEIGYKRLRFTEIFTGWTQEGDAEEIWDILSFPVSIAVPVKGRKRLRQQPYKYVVVMAKKGSIRDLVQTCDARHWTGITKDTGKYDRMTHKDSVTVHRIYVDNPAEEVIEALRDYVEFLNAHGVILRSKVTSGGLSLFKTTLENDVDFWAPEVMPELVYPGRLEYFGDRYQNFWNMAYYDLKEAYPTALSESPIPTRWKMTSPENWRDHIDGFSHATVHIPTSDPPPLPLQHRIPTNKQRKRPITYGSGTFSGWWTHREMMPAYERGYIVRVNQTHVPARYTEVFMSDRWQELRKGLRGLPGLAGRFGKMADNGMWGLIGFDGTDRRLVTWTDAQGTDQGRITVRPLASFREVHSLGVSVTVSSRVRAKLWDAMQKLPSVYCATDGIIAKYSSTPVLGPEWVLKEYLNLVAIKDVACYAYYNSRSPLLQYVGTKDAFDHHKEKPGWLLGDIDSDTLPSMAVRKLYLGGYIKGDD